METEERAMRNLMPPLQGCTVLDLAGGTGRYGLIAKASGAAQVMSMDSSPAMLRANALSQRAQATTEAIPLRDSSVDVILCGLALGHLPRPEPSLAEMGRILKVGGIALVSDFHPFIFLSGGRRTFQAGAQTYAVEHYAHLYTAYHQAAEHAGLRIEQTAEPGLDAKPDIPVVIVYRLRKEGD
jgi:malonyl-CoA O-methyltransferase